MVEDKNNKTDEEKEEEEGKVTTPATDPGTGSEPESTSDLDRADAIAERMEKANQEKKELITRDEALEVRKRLGGEADAGQPAKPQRTEAEQASRDKVKAYGKSTGAGWAADMEKEDGGK